MGNSFSSLFNSVVRFFSKSYKIISINSSSLKDSVLVSFRGYQLFFYTIYLFLLLLLFVFFLIGYGPLKSFLPQNIALKKGEIIELVLAVDSLQRDLEIKSKYIYVLKKALSGENIDGFINAGDSSVVFKNLDLSPSKEDSALRKLVENEDLYNIPVSYKSSISEIKDLFFFKPVNGFVIDSFCVTKKHFGVDVATTKNEAIKAVLDGVVIFSDWSVSSGYTILIQHPENIISVYMHASSLTKVSNNIVRSGEVIGVVGNTGEYSSGPHLHFELWQNGVAVNPLDYLSF